MKIIRNLLKGISLTAAMFVFQACYGTERDWYGENNMTFHVVSAEDGSPMPHVKIRSQLQVGDTNQEWYLLGYTNDEGIASVWVDYNYGDNFQTLFRFLKCFKTSVSGHCSQYVSRVLHHALLRAADAEIYLQIFHCKC